MNDTPPNFAENPVQSDNRRSTARYWLMPLIVLSAWAVPGLGHGLLGRWGRGAVFFIVVGGLALAGYAQRGFVFPAHSNSPFGSLGFLADAASGVFYLIAHFVERAGPDMSLAAGDIGTRLIATAGVVNLIAIVDVIEIVNGRRA